MPVLSAKCLTEDAEGCSRLRAVIAADPGYAARAAEAASGVVHPYASRRPGLPPEATRNAEGHTACATVNAASSSFFPSTGPALSSHALALTSGLVSLVVSAPLVVVTLALGRPVL
jgi:hypothetical protein